MGQIGNIPQQLVQPSTDLRVISILKTRNKAEQMRKQFLEVRSVLLLITIFIYVCESQSSQQRALAAVTRLQGQLIKL